MKLSVNCKVINYDLRSCLRIGFQRIDQISLHDSRRYIRPRIIELVLLISKISIYDQ